MQFVVSCILLCACLVVCSQIVKQVVSHNFQARFLLSCFRQRNFGDTIIICGYLRKAAETETTCDLPRFVFGVGCGMHVYHKAFERSF